MNLGSMVILFLAILGEVVGTVALKASDGFARLGPSVVVVGYGLSFYLLALALKQIPLGVPYAIWSGLGTAGAVVAGILLWRESLNLAGVVGILLIIAGVVLLNVFSGASAHWGGDTRAPPASRGRSFSGPLDGCQALLAAW
jgi:small multidrug resistance pump